MRSVDCTHIVKPPKGEMAGYIHNSVQLSEDLESSSSVGFFGSKRSTISGTSKESNRSSKKRKTFGINSRFDEMVETMSAIHRSPYVSGRRRAFSSGSPSGNTSNDTQSTMEKYHTLQEGRLGKDFALIKKGTGQRPNFGEDWATRSAIGAHKNEVPHCVPNPLPHWLCNTFSNLVPRHPLRLLLPESYQKNAVFGLSGALDYQVPTEGGLICASSAALSQFLTKPYNGPESTPLPLEAAEITTPNTDLGQISYRLNLGLLPNPEHSLEHHSEFNPCDPGTDRARVRVSPSAPGLNSLVSAATTFPVYHARPARNSGFGEADVEESPLEYELCHTPARDYVPLSNFGLQPTMSPPQQNSEISGYPSDDVSDPFSSLNDDTYTDETTSDPPLSLNIYIPPNIFSTPGPGYRPTHQIRFKSPTEDPVDSDPFHLETKTDYEVLDFHWTPFDRKSIQNYCKIPIPIQPTLEEFKRNGSDDGTQDNSFISLRDDVCCVKSPGPFRYCVDEEFLNGIQNQHEPLSPDTKAKPARVFAPAPGIFISPLRDPLGSETRDEEEGFSRWIHAGVSKPDPERLVNSQTSNDSIESWQDE